MIIEGFKGVVNTNTIVEYIKDEYNLPSFYSPQDKIIDEVEFYQENGENLAYITITDGTFISLLHEYLKDAHKVFAIPVELPYFSKDGIGDISYKYIKERYPKLTFIHLPYHQAKINVTVTYYYALSDANLTELEEFYPEVLV